MTEDTTDRLDRLYRLRIGREIADAANLISAETVAKIRRPDKGPTPSRDELMASAAMILLCIEALDSGTQMARLTGRSQ